MSSPKDPGSPRPKTPAPRANPTVRSSLQLSLAFGSLAESAAKVPRGTYIHTTETRQSARATCRTSMNFGTRVHEIGWWSMAAALGSRRPLRRIRKAAGRSCFIGSLVPSTISHRTFFMGIEILSGNFPTFSFFRPMASSQLAGSTPAIPSPQRPSSVLCVLHLDESVRASGDRAERGMEYGYWSLSHPLFCHSHRGWHGNPNPRTNSTWLTIPLTIHASTHLFPPPCLIPTKRDSVLGIEHECNRIMARLGKYPVTV